MKLGSIGTCALGLTVALALGSVSASAQTDTTTRDTAGVNGSTSGTTTARTGRYHHRLARNTAMASDTSCRHMSGTNMSDSSMANCNTRSRTRHHRRHRAMRTATSSTRIPVSKQSSGEVTQPDTTTPPPPPPPTPAPDTTTPPPPPPPPPAPETTTVKTDTTATTTAVVPPISLNRLGSFYWGIGAGASLPQQNMTNGYHPGWNVTVPFGWDSQNSPLGLRADLGYDRLSGRSDVGVNGDLAIWSANADAKLHLGSLLRHFYVLGGVGANRIVGYGTNNATYTTTTGTYGTGTTTTTTTNGYNGTYPTGTVATSFGNAKTEMNWNAGAGVNFGWGRSAMFLESRYFHVNTNDTFGANTRFVPVIIGLTFR